MRLGFNWLLILLFKIPTTVKKNSWYVYLEPGCPLFLGFNPPKEGPYINQNKGHLGSRHIYIYYKDQLHLPKQHSNVFGIKNIHRKSGFPSNLAPCRPSPFDSSPASFSSRSLRSFNLTSWRHCCFLTKQTWRDWKNKKKQTTIYSIIY